MDATKFYKLIRAQIVHEDNLCNHRMTWLVALQAFLFGAYGFSLSAESGPNASAIAETIAKARAGIALVGMITPIVTAAAIWAAIRSIGRLVDRWHERSPDEVNSHPQIIGNHSMEYRRGTYLGQVPLMSIPFICFCGWFYIGFENTYPILSYLAYVAVALAIFAACLSIFYAGSLFERRKSRRT
jgi:hypothetical protein